MRCLLNRFGNLFDTMLIQRLWDVSKHRLHLYVMGAYSPPPTSSHPASALLPFTRPLARHAVIFCECPRLPRLPNRGIHLLGSESPLLAV